MLRDILVPRHYFSAAAVAHYHDALHARQRTQVTNAMRERLPKHRDVGRVTMMIHGQNAVTTLRHLDSRQNVERIAIRMA